MKIQLINNSNNNNKTYVIQLKTITKTINKKDLF